MENTEQEKLEQTNTMSRREVLKKAGWALPVIATASIANTASAMSCPDPGGGHGGGGWNGGGRGGGHGGGQGHGRGGRGGGHGGGWYGGGRGW